MRAGPPGGFAEPLDIAIDSPEALTSENITGGIALGAEPRLGVAVNAGILTGRPTVRPPRTQQGPNIDGRLDDAVWRSAVRITEFIQRAPVEGAPATEPTDVYMAYDSQYIYFAFHAHYSDPGVMRANRVDRDQAFLDDSISVYFDPFLDQQRAAPGILSQSREPVRGAVRRRYDAHALTVVPSARSLDHGAPTVGIEESAEFIRTGGSCPVGLRHPHFLQPRAHQQFVLRVPEGVGTGVHRDS